MQRKNSRFIISLAALASIAACSNDQPAAESAHAPTTVSEPTVPAIRAPLRLVATPTALTDGSPILLGDGGMVRNQVTSAEGGTLAAIGVQVGNYGGSDGVLAIKICKELICSEATTQIAKAADNGHLIANLDTPIEISANDTLQVSIGRRGGQKPFALWRYSANAGQEITLPDSSVVPGTLSFKLGFSN